MGSVEVSALPDMLTFTPDGKTVLVANEGEPNDDYSIDPEGSISVIDVSTPSAPVARSAGFAAFNGQEKALRAQGVRIYGPGASAAQDFEPEYIAVSADGATAWATLQENNALARIGVATATVGRSCRSATRTTVSMRTRSTPPTTTRRPSSRPGRACAASTCRRHRLVHPPGPHPAGHRQRGRRAHLGRG